VGSFVIDSLIFLALPLLRTLRYLGVEGLDDPRRVGLILVSLALVFVLVALLIAQSLYFIFWEIRRGATPGKKLLGLKVCGLDGRRLSFWQAMVRDLSRWFELATVLPAVVTIGATPARQRLGDLLSNCLVFHSPFEEKSQRHLYYPPEAYQIALAHLQPEVPVSRQRDAFLRFSYSYFLLGNVDVPHQEMEDWCSMIREACKGREVFLERDAQLRFFAELCFQSRLALLGGSL
jgi:uncharacterized RDD family membrane protein YckC